MNWLLMIPLLMIEMTRPDINSGTVIYVSFSEDEVTIAADSRGIIGETGQHVDTNCKISAFGDKFVFSMGGVVGVIAVGKTVRVLNAHTIAREIWKTESKSQMSALKLVPLVAEKWATTIEKSYARPEIISELRKSSTGEPVIANGIFAATDKAGNLALSVVNIWFDLPLFDSTGTVHVSHSRLDEHPGSWSAGGHNQIAIEFKRETSPRAKNYMARFREEIAPLVPSQQHAALAAKLVELSILLHPQKNDLGFPIDVLQLKRTIGIRWVSIKPNCPQN